MRERFSTRSTTIGRINCACAFFPMPRAAGFVDADSRFAAATLARCKARFRAPMVLGGDGLPSVAALALSRLAEAPRFTRVALRELGPDVWESYERAS